MLTSKQRAYLKSMSNKLESIFHIGKQGITPAFTDSLDDALEKRELVKITVLDNSPTEIKEIADILSERTKSEVVQIIGKKIVLYRQSKKHQQIIL